MTKEAWFTEYGLHPGWIVSAIDYEEERFVQPAGAWTVDCNACTSDGVPMWRLLVGGREVATTLYRSVAKEWASHS